MKTRMLVVLLSCVGIEALGQGVVQFRNYYQSGSTLVDAPVWDYCITHGPLDNSNPLWRAALIGGPTTGTPANVAGGVMGNLALMYNPVNTTLTWTGFRAPPNAGYVTVANASRVVPGVNWGGMALVQMVAWQGDYTTWVDAFNAYMAGLPGVLAAASNPLTLTLPTGPTDPNLTYLVGLQGFGFSCLPEPDASTLAALGVAVWSMNRRKKGKRTKTQLRS